MPVPSKRRVSSQGKRRRSHDALKKMQLVKNSKGNPTLPHRVSPIDGTYKGRQVIVKKAKKKATKA